MKGISGSGVDRIVTGQPRTCLRAFTERVAAELEILGFDISGHVLDFYAELLDELGVVRSSRLDACRNGETICVAGVKVATQTPAVRSGQRIIFASLDDAVGLVDLTFFESVQDSCACTVFSRDPNHPDQDKWSSPTASRSPRTRKPAPRVPP